MEEISRVKDGTPTDEELEELGDKIVENWKKLGRRLDVTDSKLLEIGQSHDQPSEKGYYMLKHWKQEKGSGATYQALCDALKHRLVQRQDLAEQFCYINGPLPAGHVPEERVTGEVPGASAGAYTGTSAQHQDNSSGVKSNRKRKSSDPNPERGNLPMKISCARATSRNSRNQDPQEEREKVNRYMEEKIDEVKSQRMFDLSTTMGIRHFCTYLVGELHLMNVNFQKSSIKVIVKCGTMEILEGLWCDYCSGHLNVVAEECLITEEVKEELGMDTIKLNTTILEEDYVACKLSLIEIPAQFVPAAAADVDDRGGVEKLTGPGKGKKKRKNKGRGGAGRGRGRGQVLPTPGRHKGAGRSVDDDEVEVESEVRPPTGARSVPEALSSTTAEYDELQEPEIGQERPRETKTIANEIVGEVGRVAPAKASTAVDKKQEPGCSASRAKTKLKGKQQQVPGPSKLSTSSPSSGTNVKEPQSVAAANTTASTLPSTVTAAAGAAEAASVPAPSSSAAVRRTGVPTTTADGKQDVEKLATKLASSLTTKARQTQGNGGPHPPKRPGYGTVGRPIRLRANFFHLNVSSQLSDLYHYDVVITPNKCPRSVKRDVVNEIIRRYKDTTFQGHHPAFDGEKNLYSRIKLPPVSLGLTAV